MTLLNATHRSLVVAIKFGLALNLTAVASAATLSTILVQDSGSNSTSIDFMIDGRSAPPTVFQLENPSRLVVDLPTDSVVPKYISSSSQRVLAIDAISSGNVTRSVVTMQPGLEHRVEASEFGYKIYLQAAGGTGVQYTNNVQPSFDNQAGLTMASAQPIAAPTLMNVAMNSRQVSSQAIDFKHSVKAIDFGGSDNIGEAVLTVRLSDREVVSDIQEKSGTVIITLDDASVAKDLQRRLDVRDFDTPVMYVDTRQKGNKTVITITPRTGLYDLSNFQTNNVLKIRLGKRKNQNKIVKSFDGKRLSMNFQDIDVRAALQMIADFNDQNMVVSDSVAGALTLRLRNVPWDEALDIVLRTKGLDSRSNGNVLYVAPASELAALEAAELQAQSAADNSAPLVTTYIPVNYAKAEEVAIILGHDSSKNNQGVLSSRGSVAFDKRTNTLLITETSDRIAEVREVLRRIDIPVKQVMIEARIVVANDEFERELGMSVGARNYGDSYELPGSSSSTTVNSGFNINLASATQSAKLDLQLAKLPLGRLLDLELSAMQAEGRGEVISSPRVITTNQKVAIIEQGVEVPYLVREEGDISVEFRKATLALEVTPQITPDERIIMDIKLKRDTVGTSYGEGATQVPSIDTRNVETQVLVRNGETVVLGGIYEKLSTAEKDGIPGLSDLPLIGRAFQHTKDVTRKNELLVFVTPKLLRSDL